MALRHWIVAAGLFGGGATADLAMASVQVAVVTRVEGDSQLFTDPVTSGKPVAAEGPHALHEGVYYRVRPVKRGDRLQRGNIIQSGTTAKVRLIYKNGDQLTISPNTAYLVTWDEESDKKPLVNLMFGKVRAVIQSGGPRSDLEVKTRTAVMGVRGTDFQVSAWSPKGGAEVTVLRGKVAVQPTVPDAGGKPAQVVEVPAGSSAIVSAPPPAAPKASDATKPAAPAPVAPLVEVRKSTQQELVVLQHSTRVEAPKGATATADGEASAEIAALEQQAVETTLADIKTTDPTLYEQIKQGPAPKDVDQVQRELVKKMFQAAPVDKSRPKPSLKDLEPGGDAYDQYRWGD